MTTIAIANMTTTGDTPIEHPDTKVGYAPATVESISTSTYATSKSTRVYPMSRWNDGDVVPIANYTDQELDVWFGDPFGGGTQVTFDLAKSGSMCLLKEDPISGWNFLPQSAFIVGDRMIVYTAAELVSSGRRGRIAIFSAAMSDIQSWTGSGSNIWTLHGVSDEHSSTADLCGGLWGMSKPKWITDPQGENGAYYSGVIDYDSSTTDKDGAQFFALKIDEDGGYVDMGQFHFRKITSTDTTVSVHAHPTIPVVRDDGSVDWPLTVGDGDKTKFEGHYSIPDITDLFNGSISDLSSGIGSDYRIKTLDSGSPGDTLGELVVTGGHTDYLNGDLDNSPYPNAFILFADPNNDGGYIVGGDNSGHLISRHTVDQYNTAITEPVFLAVSRNARMVDDTMQGMMSVFMVDGDGQNYAAIVGNEFDQGAVATAFTGVIQTTDGGQTWGWVWNGATGVGDGLARLTNGNLILGANAAGTTVRRITPGARVVVESPKMVGFRETNLISGALINEINDDDGEVALGTTPQVDPPSALYHKDRVMTLVRSERDDDNDPDPALNYSPATIEIVDDTDTNGGLPNAPADYETITTTWIERRLTPTADTVADKIGHTLIWTMAGPTSGGWGSAQQSNTPAHTGASNDWVRKIAVYEANIGDPRNDVSATDHRVIPRGPGLGSTVGKCEVIWESCVVDSDRPPLPFPTRNGAGVTGVSALKSTGLGVGETFTALYVARIPDECWDAWSFGTGGSGAWAAAAPLLALSNAADSAHITFDGLLSVPCAEGSGSPTDSDPDTLPIVNPSFTWGLFDSASGTRSTVSATPIRGQTIVVAVSKDGTGDIQYAIGTPAGISSGTRSLASAIDLDTARFSNVGETDALEMHPMKLVVDGRARTASELETLIKSATIPQLGGRVGPRNLSLRGLTVR